MAIPHAGPGEVIDVGPLGSALAQSETTTLVKTDRLQVLRLVLPAGKEIAEHQAGGEITVHCLEGRVAFTTMGKTEELTAGKMLFLSAGERHALKANEPSSVLVTLMLTHKS